MGNDLAVVDWGSGFVVETISCGYAHSCAVSTEGEVRCVGYNHKGQLGVGHTDTLGDDEDGDSLQTADLGSNFVAVQVECGVHFTCVRSIDGEAKCFGYGGHGQLGYGDTQSRGDAAGEMGDNLENIDFGDSFDLKAIRCGGYHVCALSTAGYIKCFGYNAFGQLGYGDTMKRGDSPNEMGNSLNVVDLGTGFVVRDVAAYNYHTCALSTNGELKCFGNNQYGSLGLGHTSNVGDTAGDMGDNLFSVDIGSGFTASGVSIGKSEGWHQCVFEDDASANMLLKCFGRNSKGQLGYADTVDRGSSSGQMGDDLDFVDLGFTARPSSHWIAAGNPANDNWRDGIPNVECAEDSRVKASDATVYGDDIGVSCCSVDGSNGVREFDGQCYQAVTYGDAERICEDNGLRLCSLSEMLGKATEGAGCSHDARYNWVADECGSESGHSVHQGRTSWSWGSGKEDNYCQSDDNNQAAYWSSKHASNIGVGCCYEDASSGTVKGARPDCNAHPSTFAEAESVCADHDMRLCTLAEMATGITEGTGCWYDAAYQWVSDSCDLPSPSANAAATHSMHSEDAGESFDDFAAIVLGATAGMAMVGVVVAVIVVMRRRKGTKKEEEVAMSEVVTAPKVQPAESMDGVEAMSESVTAPKEQPAEAIDGVETV